MEMPTGRSWIVRIDPISDFIPDIDNPTEFDEGLGLVAEALDGRPARQVVGVHKYIACYGEMHPTLAIVWALMHPDTPFGHGWQPPMNRWLWAEGIRMFVNYRGRFYTRDQRGVLTDRGEAGMPWPGRAEFFECIRLARESS